MRLVTWGSEEKRLHSWHHSGVMLVLSVITIKWLKMAGQLTSQYKQPWWNYLFPSGIQRKQFRIHLIFICMRIMQMDEGQCFSVPAHHRGASWHSSVTAHRCGPHYSHWFICLFNTHTKNRENKNKYFIYHQVWKLLAGYEVVNNNVHGLQQWISSYPGGNCQTLDLVHMAVCSSH